MSRPPMKPNTRKLTSAERRAIWARRFKILLQGMLGLALVAGSAWGSRALYGVFRTSPYLHVQELHIEGNNRAKTQDLHLLAGPIEGVHLLDLHLDWARQSVIKHPWVRDASLEINFPDEVVLRVLEAEPVALLMAGDLYYLDAEGRPFVKVKPGELVDLPVLTGLEDREHLLRQEGALGVRALRYGLDLMALLERQAPELGPVSEVHISLDEGFSFFLEDGSAEVLLGFEEFGIKLERLALLREREGIDLKRVGRVNLDLERAAVVTALPSRLHRR